MKNLSVLIVVLQLYHVVPANAQNVEEQARAAFEEGTDFFREDKFLDAVEAFRRAYTLRPNWKLLYNIAQSEASARRYGIALEMFEKYLAEGGDNIAVERRDEIVKEIRRLREIVGAVEIKAPDGAVVLVDGFKRETAPLPGPMLISAGSTHSLVIELNGEILVHRQVRVSGGQTIRVEATVRTSAVEPASALPPAAAAVDSPPILLEEPTAPPPNRLLNTTGLVLMGGGGALVLSGLITGSIAVSIGDDLDSNCPEQRCAAEYWDENDRRIRLALATDVLLALGVVAAATGVVLVVLDRKKQKKERVVSISFTVTSVHGRF